MKALKNSPTVYFLIIAVFILGLFLLLKKNSSQDEAGVQEAETETPETPVVKLVDPSLAQTKIYKTPTEYAVFDVSYPQFNNASLVFNKKIEDLVTEGIEGHAKDSEANWKSRYETRFSDDEVSEFPTNSEKFQFSVSWKPIQLNKNFVSVLLVIGGYTGGAHGYQNLASFNYDVEKSGEVALKDLFPNDSNYLKTISDFSRTKLKSKFGKDANQEMLMAGTEPVLENFSVFTFTPEQITFYFTQYQVAPYAMGESTVVMPRK